MKNLNPTRKKSILLTNTMGFYTTITTTLTNTKITEDDLQKVLQDTTNYMGDLIFFTKTLYKTFSKSVISFSVKNLSSEDDPDFNELMENIRKIVTSRGEDCIDLLFDNDYEYGRVVLAADYYIDKDEEKMEIYRTYYD